MNTLKKIFFGKKRAIIGTIFAALVLMSAVTQGFFPRQAQAAGAVSALHGYAWSSTIGWISLNCAEGNMTGGTVVSDCSTSPYSVAVDPATGNLTGYAWSSNIGWIHFGGTECGSAATINLTTNAVFGWAVAESGVTDSYDWDGCISLNGTSPTYYGAYGVTYNPASTAVISFGGVTLPGKPLTGYAWGSLNTGWVNFDYATALVVPVAAPTVDLKVNDGGTWSDGPVSWAYISGYPIVPVPLEWSSANVSSCTASSSPSLSDWNSTVSIATSGTLTSNMPTGTYTYTITCHPTDPVTYPTDVTDSVVVTYSSTLPYLNFFTTTPAVPISSSATLYWSTKNIKDGTCIASSPTGYTGWSGSQLSNNTDVLVPANSFTTSGLTSSETFVLSGCSSLDGLTVLPPQTVTVNVLGTGGVPSVELQVAPDTVTPPTDGPLVLPTGGNAVLSWLTTNLSGGSCTLDVSPTDSHGTGWYGEMTSLGVTPSSPSLSSTLDPDADSSDTLNLPFVGATYYYNIHCTPPGGGSPVSSSVEIDVGSTIPPIPPSVNLLIDGSAGPVTMSSSGGPATLSWTSTSVSSCSASASIPEADWSGSQPVSSTGSGISVASGAASHFYTIVCTPTDTTLGPVSSTVEADVPAGTTTTTTGGTGTKKVLPWIEF